MQVYPILYLATAGLLVSAILRVYRARRKIREAEKHWIFGLPAILNCLAGLLIVISLFLGSSLFFQERNLTALQILALIILVTSTNDLLLSMRYGSKSKRLRDLIGPSIAVILGCCALAFVCYLRSIPGNNSNAIQLSYPGKGKWKAVTGGRSALTNYHHNNPPAQNLAVDLIYEQGNSEGQKIYAPIDGLVIAAVNDRTPGSTEPDGNLVIIKTQNRIEIRMAHLRQNSVLVHSGEQVIAGQAIAQCGATGSADEAHLHIHAQRDKKAAPMVFGEGQRFLCRNDQFQN